MHPMLHRLEDLGACLATRGDVVGLLGVGSAGSEHDRMDEHSDLDFFVVVDEAAKPVYLASLDWLEAPHPVAYSFINSVDGRKALYADGIFVEYAVFTLAELPRIPFTGARVVWQREDAPTDLATCAPPLPTNPLHSVEFHLNEALTNLYVGLHRELRGERLVAARFIQSLAVDRAISLLDLTEPSPTRRRDPFESSRRVEQAYGPDVLPLARMVPGYEHNIEAAAVTLAWLRERFTCDPVITDAVRQLLARG
ncbi:MAG: hypothetical protein ACTHOD_15970 [Motilibacteraceae bacterium]